MIAAVLTACSSDSTSSLGSRTSYTENFQAAVGSEWSSQEVESSPNGQQTYLGLFVTDAVTLTLDDLAAHDEVHIEFDLHIIGSWDGNGDLSEATADDLIFSVGNTTVLRATFANDTTNTQSYPQGMPAANVAGAQSVTVNSLGYDFDLTNKWDNSTYRVILTVPHTSSTLAFTIDGDPTNTTEESWAIDNVIVTVN